MLAKKEFAMKIAIKVLVGLLIIATLDIIKDLPTVRAIQDQIALKQMETSGLAYMIMESFDKFVRGAKHAVNIIISVMIGIDIYNYVNKIKE